MRPIRFLLTALMIVTAFGVANADDNKDTIYQVSTIGALMEGAYDGAVSFGELAQHGDFGIGTFDSLDGEMVALDGGFYGVGADGKAYPVAEAVKTPFAAVTFFEADKIIRLGKPMSYGELTQHLDTLLPTRNIFYAIKLEGTFKYVKTRSVPRQAKPYPPLLEVTKNQSVFEFHNVEGTVVGFWFPQYMGKVNLPGYHLHFITKDRTGGGHILDCEPVNVVVEIDDTRDFFMVLPSDEEFDKVDLEKDTRAELAEAEQ